MEAAKEDFASVLERAGASPERFLAKLLARFSDRPERRSSRLKLELFQDHTVALLTALTPVLVAPCPLSEPVLTPLREQLALLAGQAAALGGCIAEVFVGSTRRFLLEQMDERCAAAVPVLLLWQEIPLLSLAGRPTQRAVSD